MQFRRELFLVSAVVLLAFSSVSCARVGGWMGRSPQPAETAGPQVAVQRLSGEDPEAQLRRQVETEIAAHNQAAATDRNRVIRRRPFWLKEYAEFPAPTVMQVEIQETESRSRPYLADVRVEKVRFATKMHRDRGAAQQDTHFFRDTGMETMTYEYRNGRWQRVGGLFVAERSEEMVNGQWVAVREPAQRAEAPEEPGWFGRTWGRVVGRN